MSQKRSLEITGMSCQMCVKHVTNALAAVPGVRPDSVQVGSAEVEYDPAAIEEEQIISAIAEAGYSARFTA